MNFNYNPSEKYIPVYSNKLFDTMQCGDDGTCTTSKSGWCYSGNKVARCCSFSPRISQRDVAAAGIMLHHVKINLFKFTCTSVVNLLEP